jgi:glycosyltransferase involved in cell wall biosynthesis
MRIALDAKRAFHNGTGLGHYSRTLIRSLAADFPQHQYLLVNPKPGKLFSAETSNMQEINPGNWFNKLFSGFWRSNSCKRALQLLETDLYHGLSHEIPFGIEKTGIPTVVTMHDLIPERNPEQYAAWDLAIYKKKFRYACEKADRIIAISEQTKQDIIQFYKTDPGKIRVCYQSCNPAFAQRVSEEEKLRIRLKYELPDNFYLSVGSIIERKNLLNVCKALALVKQSCKIPLVVIGNGGAYKKKVTEYIREAGLQNEVIFLSDNPRFKKDPGFITATDFPAIYQSARLLLYPSYFEGFGIPVLEGLWSRIPVITSNVSCLPEAGGKGAYYVNPDKPEEIAVGMQRILEEKELASTLTALGWEHAQNFTPDKAASCVMNVYNEILKK